MKVDYITNIEKVEGLSRNEKNKLKKVTEKYAFRANSYYLSLINWSDPNDPIRRIIIPTLDELEEWGSLDPSDEKSYTVAPGVEHKYPDTALVLLNNFCGGYCRFCFRKRLFIRGNKEVARDPGIAIDYLREHSEINNVLISGGDPLLLSTRRLREFLFELRKLDHVHIIRIGTKVPAFNPHRIIDDEALLKTIRDFSAPDKRIYVMAHFNHVAELTPDAITAIKRLILSGAVLCNQTPLIRGLNDSPDVLSDLFERLSFIGVPPYYVFQGRPLLGNKPYAVSVEDGYGIFEEALKLVSGLAKRAKFVMSHATGKVEIVGLGEDRIFMRYHRAPTVNRLGGLKVFKRNREGYWLDDFEQVIA
jgi:KamA family protein